MQGELADGTLLKYWYDYLLAVPVLVLAAYLTFKVTVSMSWTSRGAKWTKVLSIVGTALVLLIVLDRLGIKTLKMNAQVYGYLSLLGGVTAIVLGGTGTLLTRGRHSGKSQKPDAKSQRSASGGIMAALLSGLGLLLIRLRCALVSQKTARDAPPLDMSGDVSGATVVLTRVRGAAAWLVVCSGAEQGRIIELNGDRVTIGRSPDDAVYIDHPSIGASHSLIRRRHGKYWLSDLGSRTGTWVNGKLEAGIILAGGSRISVGTSELFFSKVDGVNGNAPEGAGPKRGVLLVRSGPSTGQNFPVVLGDLIIGRQPGEGGARIDDPSVSHRHAMLRLMPRGCRLYDLGSANGTKVDDVELQGVPLKNGDMLTFGQVEVQFVQEEST